MVRNTVVKSNLWSLLFQGIVLLLLVGTELYANPTVTSATLNNSSNVIVTPLSTVSATVNVFIPSNNTSDRWRSTGWRIGTSGSYTCVDTTNYSNTGNYSNSFSITAPATVGSYTVSFIAYSDGSCSNNPSSAYNLPNGLVVIPDVTTYTQDRDFALRNSINARGDIKVIGNTILCKSSNGASNGTCVEPGNTEANNDFYAIYNDIDGDSATTSSTSADLALPAGSKILWAGLYWQGQFPTGFSTDKATAKTVKLKMPNTSGYTTVTASQLDYDNGTDGYQGFADVTSLLNLNNPNGTYYVGNILTALGYNAYGAWALSVIYQDNTDSLKNITAYDGFKAIFSSSSTQTVNVSGFRTPLSGPIASTFFIFGAEGDAAYTGEGLQIKNGAGTFTNISNTLNPSNNQFNSNITYKNAYVTNRSPAWQNTAGIDIDTYDVSNILGNNQTSTQIKLIGGGNDRYFVGVFGFSTQIYSPTIGNFNKNATVAYSSNQSCHGDKDLRGATIHYDMTFQNTGTEAASTVKVYDDFQSNGILSYLDMNQTTKPTVQLMSGTGASSITCDKNATAIYCNFDRINIGTQYKISFDVKVKSTLLLPNDVNLSNVANAHYYNASTLEEITQIATSNMQMAGGICAVLPVVNYRFDECVWNGITGEVIDSSGNNYNANSVNGLNTIDNGEICRTTIFNGSTQYVSSSAITSYLQTTASLSFWIKTTQAGNDTMWLAPGVTGVEQNGGANDVFWGWLDASGHIGIMKGNTAGAQSTDPINDGTWKHIVLTRDSSTGTVQVYVNGVLDQTATSETGNVTTSFTSIGRIEDTANTPAYFNGNLDEIKVFDRVLNESEVANIFNNETAHNNFDGTGRTCSNCGTIPVATNIFDAWDSFRSISDRKISTKIVGKDFNLVVDSLDTTFSALQSFNGTVCVQLLTFATNSELARQCKAWNNITTKIYDPFNISQANDDVKVKLAWKKDDISGTFSVGSEDNSTIASDYFAIRPASFTITASNAVAGSDFNITFSAPIFNAPDAPSSSYNETSGTSFDVNITEHNTSCAQGIFTPTPTNFSFLNGTKIVTTRYSEVGILDINISDIAKPCASRFAHVDCNDADIAGYYNSASDLPIGSAQKSITVIPHHFDVNATLTNFDAIHGGNFTYLSNDANLSAMSADLNITVTAQTEGNTTTKNYNTLCYAKQTNYTINYIAPTITPSTNLSSLNYLETNTSKSGSVSRTATAFKLPNTVTDSTLVSNTIFGTDTNGSAKLSIKINFDRDNAKPVNPFDFNITSAITTDTDSVSGNDTTVGNATFIYGRVRAYDITTNEAFAPNPVEFEVYSTLSTGYVNGMPQNVLHWYRNTNHINAAEGNVIRGGFTAGATDLSVTTSVAPQYGIQNVTVTSLVDQTVHLDINKWLWYSSKYDYDYSTNCTQHPCFFYDHANTATGVTGVNTGTFQGSDFEMAPAKNITNKGVKLFR